MPDCGNARTPPPAQHRRDRRAQPDQLHRGPVRHLGRQNHPVPRRRRHHRTPTATRHCSARVLTEQLQVALASRATIEQANRRPRENPWRLGGRGVHPDEGAHPTQPPAPHRRRNRPDQTRGTDPESPVRPSCRSPQSRSPATVTVLAGPRGQAPAAAVPTRSRPRLCRPARGWSPGWPVSGSRRRRPPRRDVAP